MDPCRTGAYGLRWTGIDCPGLLEALPAWPEVRVAPDLPATEDAVVVELTGGRAAALSREPLAVRLEDGRVPPHELAQLAAILSGWAGRVAFQAGAVVAGGRAVAVAGPMAAGKSTLLAAAARGGMAVLCDELLAVEAGVAMGGPARLELRQDSAAALGGADIALADPPRSAPLAAWVFLAWGDAPAVAPLAPRERFAALTAASVGTAEAGLDPALLELARLPAFRLTRPRAWDGLEDSVAALGSVLDRI